MVKARMLRNALQGQSFARIETSRSRIFYIRAQAKSIWHLGLCEIQERLAYSLVLRGPGDEQLIEIMLLWLERQETKKCAVVHGQKHMPIVVRDFVFKPRQ